jgi:hypothetical protein
MAETIRSAMPIPAENAPARRDADEADVPLRPVAHHFGDPALHLARDVHAARAPVDVAECEASLCDRGVIDDRHKARRVGHESAIKERLVPVRQADQIDVTLKVGRLRVQVIHHAFELPVNGFHGVWQKPFQPVFAPLFLSECRAFVQGRGVEQFRSP